LARVLGDTHFIVARPPDDGIFPHDAYEMQWLLASMAERPEVIERIIEVESSYYIEMGKLMLDAGCDAVITHNDVAGRNGPFMSPAMFKRFCGPWLKAWADMAHARGKHFFKHTDGNTWKILDFMIEAGVDAWHGIQPSIGVTLPELQAQYSGRLCFWGGVDLDSLIAGTEDQVENEVRLAIESSPTEGGLILGAGNAVMVGVRPASYLAMMRAARAFQPRRPLSAFSTAR
jgi:uroporphyrinogen decarboxylase